LFVARLVNVKEQVFGVRAVMANRICIQRIVFINITQETTDILFCLVDFILGNIT